jgi:hypothetical protein
LKAHFAKNATHYFFPEYFQTLRPKNRPVSGFFLQKPPMSKL